MNALVGDIERARIHEVTERGRFPAVNVLKSVSRTMPQATAVEFRPVVAEAKRLLATYADMEELIRLGAYRKGSSPEVDEAIRLFPALDAFLAQAREEKTSLADGYRRLAEIVGPQQKSAGSVRS